LTSSAEGTRDTWTREEVTICTTQTKCLRQINPKKNLLPRNQKNPRRFPRRKMAVQIQMSLNPKRKKASNRMAFLVMDFTGDTIAE